MKKITSFLSLALIFSVTLLLASCNECEGVSGGGGSIPADVQQQLDNLAEQLGEEAQKIDALSSDGSYVVTFDPVTNVWYLSTPGPDGTPQKTILTPTQTFKVTIGANGNWFINGVDTGTPATGAPGAPGAPGTPGTDGITPTIGANGNWWIGTTDTGVKAQGADGATPSIGANGNWWIGTTDTGVKAQGNDGADGTTPTIGANGNWWIGTTDTGVKAQGNDGADGTTPTIGANGNWWIGTTDTGIAAQGPKGEDGKSGVLDAQGVYVKYDDGGTEKTIYIPQFTDNGDGTVTIKVGGTTYTLPTSAGGGCTCNWSLTNTGGIWSISDGTNSVQIPTVPSWVNTVTVSHNGTNFEIATTTDPTKKVTIPNGYADVSIDATNGIATITSADGATSVKLQKTQPVVYTQDGSDNVFIQNYDLSGNPVGSAYELPTAGQFSTLTSTVNGINTDLTKIKAQIGNWDETKGSITDSIQSLDNRVTTLQSEVNSMFEKMLQALAAMITNIQVEEVLSNAIGSYSGVLTDLKTTKLIAYKGNFTGNVYFPSDADDPEEIPAGTVWSKDLGTIQLTVNPIGTDFSGVAVSLVNSLGEESSIKLSNLESSDKLLMTGVTRAAGTGLYETKATIEESELNGERLKVAIDASTVKNALMDLYHDLEASMENKSLKYVKGGTLNEVINAIYNVVNGISTERLAVKTSYSYNTTDINGNTITSTKSVVSPYDLSGVVVTALGFESLPAQYRDTIDVIKNAKKVVKKLNDKIASRVHEEIDKNFQLDNLEEQIKDLQIKIAKVQPVPDSMKIIKQIVDIDTTVTVTVPIDYKVPVNINTDIPLVLPVKVQYEYILPENFQYDAVTGKITYDEGKQTGETTVKVDTVINFVYADSIAIKETLSSDVHFWIKKEFAIDITDMVDNVNNALDVVASVNGLCNSANSIIDNIRNLERKLDEGKYLDGIYKFIDRVSAYTARTLYKLFQPVLLVNSDSGLSFAGIRGVPATVSGTVEVIPTTYSNGLVAPVYKRCVKVNGTYIMFGDTEVKKDITSYLHDGSNTIDYYALDYYGNEVHNEYVVIKK